MSPMQTNTLQRAIAIFLLATSGIIFADAARELRQTNPETVDLGTAAGFTVLAYATVTNKGETSIGGYLGVSPGSDVAGDAVTYSAPEDRNGRAREDDAATAKAYVTAAYLDAAGRDENEVVLSAVNLGGLTLERGLYKSTGALAVSSGDLTLDGGNSNGSPSDAVFIFQIAETLQVSSGLKMILTGGAQAKNVFWQLGSAATFEVDSVVVGTVMAYSAITVNRGCHVEGRLFALNEAVTLDRSEVVFPL